MNTHNWSFVSDQLDCSAYNSPPVAVCQNLNLDANANCQYSAIAEDFDGGSSDPDMDVMSFSVNPPGLYSIGTTTVTLTVSDPSGETSQCTATITVSDNEPPNIVCLNPTITFNGEATITLDQTDVWDDVNSTDNCGMVTFLGMSPNTISCGDIGSTIPVIVDVEDASGNPTQCSAMVDIVGLPCGLSAPQDGINCTGGNSAGYDANTDTYTINSQGCYDPAFYSPNDAHGYIGTTLCGDVEIIAEITSVTGNGWAGITMRQSATTGAPMIQLAIDGSFLSKKRFRYSPGATAFQQQYPTVGHNWLHITRIGSLTQAFHSTDGINWAVVLSVPIPFGNCVEVGMITENSDPTGTVTATFENVQINSGVLPFTLVDVDMDMATDLSIDRAPLFPNPATNEAFVELGAYVGKSTIIQIFNNTGRLIETVNLGEIQTPTQRLLLDNYQNGLHLMKIQVEEEPVITKKLMILK